MSFKEQVIDDIDNVFLNLEEFGEVHTVDGIQVSCVIHEDSISEAKNGKLIGMIDADLVIYGKAEDLNYQTGSPINVDGREYIVGKVAHEMGVVELALKQNDYE